MVKESQNLTTGSLWKKILIFSLPLMLSNVMQVLFNLSDIAVVGQFAGTEALGSVGSTTTLVVLYTGFLIGLGNGVNVIAARYYGAGDTRELAKTVHTAVVLCFGVGIVVLGAGYFLSPGILGLLHTKDELMDGAVAYLRIYSMGMPAVAVFNYGNGVFSAVGDTKKPLIFLSIAGVINVLLNLFLVIVCHMGVKGVAVASVVSQYISAVLIMITLLRTKEAYGLHFSGKYLSMKKVGMILAIGIPTGIQYAIFQVANLFIQSGVNYFSATVVSGNAAAANADGLVYDVMAAFYTACSSFIGQNYGAGKKDRILKTYFICLGYSFGIGVVLGLMLVMAGSGFLSLFTRDAAVIAAGKYRLTIMGLSYGVSAFMDCTIASSRGLGRSVIPTIIVIIGSCVFRIVWIYTIFVHFRTIQSIYLLYVFSWTLTAVAEIIYFTYIYRKKLNTI